MGQDKRKDGLIDMLDDNRLDNIAECAYNMDKRKSFIYERDIT